MIIPQQEQVRCCCSLTKYKIEHYNVLPKHISAHLLMVDPHVLFELILMSIAFRTIFKWAAVIVLSSVGAYMRPQIEGKGKCLHNRPKAQPEAV